MATDNFFDKKQPWSKVKDKVVSGYLEPYCAKLLSTGRPLKIVDCFAGKGKFDDGQEGSPIMIARVIQKILKNQISYKNKNIEACFIEKKYFNDLEDNLIYFSQYRVISGNFEDNISEILEKNKKENTSLFLYIDPYGIKSLSFNIFNELKSMDSISTEILMNFNSFGFLREGFRLMSKSNKIPTDLRESNYEVDGKNSISRMNEIANGKYWQEIIKEKNNDKITMYEAEEKFIQKYISQLKSVYTYVINIPIKEKRNKLPKYRLIFGTNHHEGLFLMVETMKKGWKLFLDSSSDHSLFDEFELPEYNIGKVDLDEVVLNLIERDNRILLRELLISLINIYGISFSISEYKDVLAKLGGESKSSLGGLFANNKIHIIRDYKTPSGKEPKDLDWNNKIYIERV